jgi:hypothetical protein
MYKMNEAFPGEFDRAMYIAVNKNTDEIYGERVKLDHLTAQGLVGKARAVVESPRPAGVLSDDPKNQACLFCEYHGLCFGTEWRELESKWQFVPFSRDRIERNCRTCLHSTPCARVRPDGSGVWECARDQDNLDYALDDKRQKTGCDRHLFVPDLLRPWTVFDADRGGEWVKYDGGVNYKGGRIEEKKQG